jgi:tetratricopeptide (TPR) repeat protein
VGIGSNVANLLLQLGQVAFYEGGLDRAECYLEEALQVSRDVDYKLLIAEALRYLGLVAVERGRVDEAENLLMSALETFRELKLPAYVGYTLHAFAAFAALRGRPEAALLVTGAANEALDAVGVPLSMCERRLSDRLVERSRQAVGAGRAEQLLAQGKGLSVDDALSLARFASTDA